MAKYKLDNHHPDEKTIPRAELADFTLIHLHERGFSFVGKEDGIHVPAWIVELVRIQERRGTAGDTIDWDLVWTKLHEDRDVRLSMVACINDSLKKHGLTREHADDIAVQHARDITAGRAPSSVDFVSLKKAHALALEEAFRVQVRHDLHHAELAAAQRLEAERHEMVVRASGRAMLARLYPEPPGIFSRVWKWLRGLFAKK